MSIEVLISKQGTLVSLLLTAIILIAAFFTFAGIALGLYFFDDKDLTTSIPKLLAGLFSARVHSFCSYVELI